MVIIQIRTIGIKTRELYSFYKLTFSVYSEGDTLNTFYIERCKSITLVSSVFHFFSPTKLLIWIILRHPQFQQQQMITFKTRIKSDNAEKKILRMKALFHSLFSCFNPIIFCSQNCLKKAKQLTQFELFFMLLRGTEWRNFQMNLVFPEHG